MFGFHHKPTLQPRESHEDRTRKRSLQVASGIVIINSTQGDPNNVRPYIQQSSELSESDSPFATPGAMSASAEPAMRRGGLSYDSRAPMQGSPVLAGRILREDVPLPQAVEALRPRLRPDFVDPGGQSSHVSSSLQGEPTTASSYTAAQSVAAA